MPNPNIGPVSTISAGFVQPVGALFDGTNVWITDFADSRLKKLDSNGVILQSVPVGTGPELSVFDGSNIWVPSYFGNTLTVVRAKDGVVLANLTGNGLSGAVQAVFDGERRSSSRTFLEIVCRCGRRLTWHAISLSHSVQPLGACGDGINFESHLQGGTGALGVVAF